MNKLLLISIALSLFLHGVVFFNLPKIQKLVNKTNYSDKIGVVRIKQLRILNQKAAKPQKQKKAISQKSQIPKKKEKKNKEKPKQELSKTLKDEVHFNQGQNSLRAKYLSYIRSEILKHQFYPKMSHRLKQEGEVIVSFDIVRPHFIRNIRIKTPSKYTMLNQAALRTVSSLGEANLKSIPSKLKQDTLNLEVPLIYSIE